MDGDNDDVVNPRTALSPMHKTRIHHAVTEKRFLIGIMSILAADTDKEERNKGLLQADPFLERLFTRQDK
jgi:hypothetical protein